jgi:hypothetical protein
MSSADDTQPGKEVDGQALPESLREVAAWVEHYGSFRRAVFALITGWILDLSFGFVSVIDGGFLYAGDLLVGSLGYVEAAITWGFGLIGLDILGALAELQRELVGVTEGAGGAAPVLAAVFAFGALYLVYRTLIVIAGLLPVVGDLLDGLGVR